MNYIVTGGNGSALFSVDQLSGRCSLVLCSRILFITYLSIFPGIVRVSSSLSGK